MAPVHRKIRGRNLRSPPPAAAHSSVLVSPAVRRAVREGRPVVALESSVFAQGLPRPANEGAARGMTEAIAAAGAVAAVTAVVRGEPTVGIAPTELRLFLRGGRIAKLSARDLSAAILRKASGATTVAAGILLAHRAGVRVFATGGIGGIHRDAPADESPDLLELARTPIIVVCAGPKAVLDVPATAERLEALGVTVVGYRTDTLPAFYTASTDFPVTIRVETARDIARLYTVHMSLRRPTALLVVQQPPTSATLDAHLFEAAIRTGVERAAAARVRGPRVTPFLLQAVEHATGGASVQANVELLVANAELAAEVAVELNRKSLNWTAPTWYNVGKDQPDTEDS
jgi:pseudouridylate synthase